MHIIHAWGMTETSPLGSVSRPPAGVEGEEAWRYRVTQGRLAGRGRGAAGRPGRLGRARGRRGGRRARGARAVDHRRRTTGDDDPDKFHDGWLRTGDVGTHHARRLPHAHRPGQGRHQVRRRVDLLGRAGERADGAPGGRRGVAWSACPTRSGASGRWPPSCVREGATVDRRGAARLPRRAGRALAAAGALGVHRRGAEDQRRQVRQEGASAAGTPTATSTSRRSARTDHGSVIVGGQPR